MIKRSFAKIISNTQIGPDIWKMSLKSPEISSSAQPGQFVFVRCSEGTDPLLRRPFSLFRIREKTFEILYKVVGKGTAALTGRQKGETLDLIGPLGNGFCYDRGLSPIVKGTVPDLRTNKVNRRIGTVPISTILNINSFLLIAGGMGIAPLHALAEKLKGKRTIAVGACNKNHLLQLDDFKKPGIKVIIATEDGSLGYRGKVTDLLSPRPKPARSLQFNFPLSQATMVFACGPYPMLKIVSSWSEKHNLPCQVSLEPHMGCGIGACLGCVVKLKTADGIKNIRACREGPVFWSKDIVWE